MPDESVRRRITYTDCHCDGYTHTNRYACRHRHGNSNSNGDGHGRGKRDRDRNRNANIHRKSNACAEGNSDGKTSSYTAPKAVVSNLSAESRSVENARVI